MSTIWELWKRIICCAQCDDTYSCVHCRRLNDEEAD
jgi:hypothetical protein